MNKIFVIALVATIAFSLVAIALNQDVEAGRRNGGSGGGSGSNGNNGANGANGGNEPPN